MYQNNEQSSVDNLAASLPCKTPVSLLQELCMRRGISPKYDLLQIEGAVHEPTFVYRVTVGEFIANGSGQSKKKAKHAAAKAVLDIIIHGGSPPATTGGGGQLGTSPDSVPVVSSGNGTHAADLSNMVVSPYDDGIPGNPVGQLQELCMTRRWPPPTYELIAEEGFPHERTFSVACTIATYKEIGGCVVSGVEWVCGGGKSKKLAKRQAAYSMFQKLQDMPKDYHTNSGFNEDDDDLAQKLALRYSNLKDTKVKCLSSADSRKVSQFHKSLKQKGGQNLKDLQVTSLSLPGVDFVQMLQNIADEVGVVVTYVGVEERSFTGEYQCLLQLSTLPVVVCFGTGATPEDAEASAAHNALEYLKIMTKSRD
ncbi:Double-stranded RNA-binding domain [Trinorchestia longiramus]|nr:Double-stranded RNA-binding domain [Trinorchestia longiramus]